MPGTRPAKPPLHIAIRGGQRELAELLLAHKADPNVRNNAGQTPLALAQSMGLSLGMGGAGPLAPPRKPRRAGVEDEHLSIGGVLYSPKPDDPELLKAGYHRDRSARTRKAECWEQRAGAELSGRGGNVIWTGTDMIEFGGEGMGTSLRRRRPLLLCRRHVGRAAAEGRAFLPLGPCGGLDGQGDDCLGRLRRV